MIAKQTKTETRNAVLAAVLSAVVPGLGHIYAGSWRRGLTLTLGLPVQAVLFHGVDLDSLAYCLLLIYLWNIVDAAVAAKGRTASAAIPVLIVVVLNLAASTQVTQFHIPQLGPQQRGAMSEIGGSVAKPDLLTRTAAGHLTWSETARTAARPMIETIYLALLGTGLSLLLAIPLSFFGARNLMWSSPVLKALYGLTRGLFTVLRSVEVLVFALIAIAAVGVGPLAGVIALAVHGVGALGKLYSESIESIEHGPIEAIRSTGANEFQVVLYGVVPQVVPQFIAFTLYRWDINVRMATVIGMVGGGGIGALLFQEMQLYQWQQAAVAIWMIAGVVMLMDYASAVIREKLI